MFRFLRSYIADSVRLALGLVLTGASVSKVLAFDPFAVSLSSFAPVPHQIVTTAAAALIALECGTGLLLLTGKFTRVAAGLALFLFVGFTAVLTAAITRNIDIPCNCFGSLGPRLPMREQAVLDLLFAVLAFFLMYAASETGGGAIERFPFTGVAAIAALLWGSSLIVWPHTERADTGRTPPPGVAGRETSGNSPGRPAVILLADFDDFGCQICLDDFLAFCDSLNGEKFRSAVDVRLLARRDTLRTGPSQARMLEGWAAGNMYMFPVSLDTGGVFERSGVGKTSAILTGADGRLIDVAHFPTGSERRDELLRAIGG